jgi:hypothetical protein
MASAFDGLGAVHDMVCGLRVTKCASGSNLRWSAGAGHGDRGWPSAAERLSLRLGLPARAATRFAPRRPDVLNRFDPRSPAEAEVKYLDGDFRVLRPGAFVRCAVTGVPIPLEELKYWSVERQEAYASPEAVLKRLHPERAK